MEYSLGQLPGNFCRGGFFFERRLGGMFPCILYSVLLARGQEDLQKDKTIEEKKGPTYRQVYGVRSNSLRIGLLFYDPSFS